MMQKIFAKFENSLLILLHVLPIFFSPLGILFAPFETFKGELKFESKGPINHDLVKCIS